jgi:hypothetical protein
MSEEEESDKIVGLYEVLQALEDLIELANPEKRRALAAAIDGYRECFPEDFNWATGASSPVLLHHLLIAIDASCRVKGKVRSRVIRLLDRKPEGNA